MQAFQRAAAVFCMACIGAELVSPFWRAKLGWPVHKSRSRAIYFSSPSCAVAAPAGQGFDRFFREYSPGGHVHCTAGCTGNGDPDRDQGSTGRVLHYTVPTAIRA